MHTMRTSCRRCKECTKPSFSCSLPGCTYDTFNSKPVRGWSTSPQPHPGDGKLQNTTPLPTLTSPDNPPRYTHIPTPPPPPSSLRTSLYSFIILLSSITMPELARLPLPPAPFATQDEPIEPRLTPNIGQRPPPNPPHPSHTCSVRTSYAHPTHPRIPPLPSIPTRTKHLPSYACASVRSPPPPPSQNPPAPPNTLSSHAYEYTFPTRLRARVPASSGEWFRPLPALGHQQFAQPSHEPTTHRRQLSSQTNPPARGGRHHHHWPQSPKCHPQNSNT